MYDTIVDFDSRPEKVWDYARLKRQIGSKPDKDDYKLFSSITEYSQ